MELVNQNSVLNFLGKKTILKFSSIIDGVVEYKTVIPKELGGDYYDVTLSFFVDGINDLLCYEYAEHLCEFKVFELWINNGFSEPECMYHKKFNEL